MKKLFAFTIALLAIAGSAAAADYNYVDSKTISPEFIDPPYAEKSQEWTKEDMAIKEMQAHADPAEIAKAEHESSLKPELVAETIKLDLNDPHFAATAKLLKNVAVDCKETTGIAKDYWHTSRPYIADKDIKPLITPATNNSYPSGHTACSRVYAEVLAQIAPTSRAALRARADEIAEHRVLGGMHWPFDLVGGRELGLLFFGALQQSAAYQQDLAAAEKEWHH